MLTSADISTAIVRIHAGIAAIRDQLNAADRVLGDGDTGMTIEQVVCAWHAISQNLPQQIGETLSLLGNATMQASGSSLGAVLSTGLSAAGRSIRGQGKVGLDRGELAALITVATDAISARSGATAGAKSMFDSLLSIRSALQRDVGDRQDVLQVVADAAATALNEFREKASQLGRARIYGEKSMGHDDPGMLAIYLLLQGAR
jgi:dihydroxyacetone kinase-like protein